MSKLNYDSEFCGSLPLHHINQIQGYGYLLVLSQSELTIVQASENVQEVFGSPVQEVVGKPISEFILPSELELLTQKFSVNITDKIPLSFTISVDGSPQEYVAIVHSRNDCLIAELEKSDSKNSFIDTYQELKFHMAKINLCTSVEEVGQVAVESLKKLAGFDRVLMYQFDESWNGSVIAEVKEEEMESYMGLKFPASDIPKQARALYLSNSYRLIPSRKDPAVRLYPVINPVTQSFTDLSGANLRSVAAVHLEYMENMGIIASMSIRVLRNEGLWGLISCHHRDTKYLNFELCSIFELLSEVISSKINSILNKEEFSYKAALLDRHALVLEKVYASASLHSGLLANTENLLGLFDADGITIADKGKLSSKGKTPSEEAIKNLVFWVQSRKPGKVLAESNLAETYDQAADYAEVASGLLVIPIGSAGNDLLLLYRPEVQKTVSWGGNPNEAIQFEQDGKKYHPRNSFKIWQETVKQTSLPWKTEELEVAENLRTFIFEYSTKHDN